MTLIHNHHKNLLRVFTTFGQHSVIVREAYTRNQCFFPIKSYIIFLEFYSIIIIVSFFFSPYL